MQPDPLRRMPGEPEDAHRVRIMLALKDSLRDAYEKRELRERDELRALCDAVAREMEEQGEAIE